MSGNDRASRTGAAVALRIAGATYPEIAETLGYENPTACRSAVENSLAHRATETDRENLRHTEGARLDRLMRAVWSKATNPDHPEQLNAVRTALSIIDRRIKMFGIDMPTETIHYMPTTAQIDAWINTIAINTLPNVEEADITNTQAISP